MVKVSGTGLLIVFLLIASLSWAAKEISVDFATGKETEWVDEAAPAPEEADAVDGADLQRELARLRKMIRLQQKLISRQQAVIEAQRKELRRQQAVNRGLEQLCRACRREIRYGGGHRQ